MMKEKNWLTWLTVLALVVGFAAMGASVWLSAQAAKQTQRNSFPSYFPVGGAKPRYFYRKKVAIGGAEGSLTGAYVGSDMVCLFADASGVYWFKGNRGQIEKIGSQAHFKKLLRQISLNKLEESSPLVKKTEKKKKQTSKKSE
ncbi:hypothetical protein LDE03_13030 [Lactobacillus delbrueckii subsp. delbrueckii]|nr:hypothetical protein [Lactobacillus delbrueckii]BBL28297.1 hypothetical protein LDE01_15940 [Lactobacillus delbrueckii subsp. delbrueckii]GEA75495.1 hypothetical protein LDE03_13030 [Lactobacillus delbrueckii subsp. delbrueckii]